MTPAKIRLCSASSDKIQAATYPDKVNMRLEFGFPKGYCHYVNLNDNLIVPAS